MKRRLKEEVGVPQGITKSAENLYTEIVQNIEMYGFDDPIVDDVSKIFQFNTNINISDLNIQKVIFKVILKYYDIDGIVFLNAGFSSPTRTNYSEFVFINQKNVGFSKFKMTLALPKDTEYTTDDIVNFIKSNSTQFISTIAHELMHAYDAYKNERESFYDRTNYASITQFSGFGLQPIKNFFHYLYLATTAEILVKPTEVASRLESGNVNKKEFLEFLLNDNTYDEFRYMYNLTYEEFYESVIVDKAKIIKLFKRSNINVPDNDTELFNDLLKYLYVDLVNNRLEILSDMLTENPLESLFGFDGSKQVFFEKTMNQYSKYEKNPTEFFKKEIEMLNFVGEKMMKKLSKLYVKAKDDTSQSDIIKRIYNKVNHEKR